MYHVDEPPDPFTTRAQRASVRFGRMRSKQAPLHSGYGEQTTAREVLGGRDLTGAFALVTGGHAGSDSRPPARAADATQLGGGRPWATDPDAAERLWGLSESWTGAGMDRVS